MADGLNKSANAEAILLRCLFKGINQSHSTSSPPDTFTVTYTSPEERLKVLTPEFADFLITVNRKYQTEGGHLLDVACGRGSISVLLTYHGLRVTSSDLSDHMLKFCQGCRESFIKEGHKSFESWEIFKADMLQLDEVILANKRIPDQFDSINCFLALMYLCSDSDLEKAFFGFANLLRPGGALIVDTRNFLYMATNGQSVQNGRNPCRTHEFNGLSNIVPYTISGPAPDHKPLAVFMDYQKLDGDSMYLVSRVFSREQITSVAKSTFGENCKITVLYDLKVESECKPEDACIITYIIEKPTI